MINSTFVTVIQENDPDEDEFHALFANIAELDPFDVKKEELAAQLSALLSFAKVNRSDFARKSGWTRSRVTNVLNGSKNLTYKTMWEFARQLGYEADLIFRIPTQHMALQPWQTNRVNTTLPQTIEANIPNRDYPHTSFAIDIQTAFDVAIDMANGRQKSHYLSLMHLQSSEIQELHHSQQKALPQTLSSITLMPSLNIPAVTID